MATSGSTDYSATATNVLTEALEILQVIQSGGSIVSADETSLLRTLNMMLKQWSANFDFAPGLKVFNRKRGYLFLQQGQSAYSLGPSGDNSSLSYVSTTMRVAGIATDTTLEITSSTGMTAADKIGIELDSGAIQWTTISVVTDGDTVTIPASGLTGAAAAGNRVFAYTTKIQRPLLIESASIRNTDGEDSPMWPMSLGYYESIASKADDSTPAYYDYENSLTNGRLQLDCEPDDVTKVVRLVFMLPTEDIDAVANDIALPQEWLLPVAHGLAKLSASKFGKQWLPQDESNFTAALAMARSSYAETSDDYFQPGLD